MSASAASGSPARLARLLEGKPAKLERYLVDHPEAEAELERLSSLPARARSALGEALRAPSDLAERLRSRLAAPATATDTQFVVMDLMGVGWQTVRVLMSEPEDPR